MAKSFGWQAMRLSAGHTSPGCWFRKDILQSIQEAFDRLLKKGAPAYVEKARLSPADSIDLIHRAGGVAVLAHPYQLKLPSYEAVSELVAELAALGLDGIEAVYSRHSPAERSTYSEIAI